MNFMQGKRSRSHRARLIFLTGLLAAALANAGCLGLTGATNPNGTPDTTGPTVAITSPTSGASVSGTVNIVATASDDSGVAGVQFKVDGANVGAEDTVPPFAIAWNTAGVAGGDHTLVAVARDGAGNLSTSAPVVVLIAAADSTPPTVSITSPANNASVSGTINIQASASDNVGVVGVQFKVDGANTGEEDTVAPYSYSLNTASLANGSHTLTAVARDAANNTATSAAVTINVNNVAPDTTAPNVSISAPAGGATVSGTISLNAAASDNVGVAGVQFKVDGVNIGAEDTTSPYSVSWDTRTVSNGSHSITAVARDAAGNTRTSAAVSVTVNNTAPDTTAPTVSISAPASGATVSGSVSLSATASDNVGVVGVQFKVDGANIGAEDSSSPYSVSWDTRTAANGSHSITAVARDAAGNTRTSAAVSVTVNNVGLDTTAPTVSISAPAAGATVSGSVTLSASASDNVGVAGVQFKVDGVNVGAEDTTSPYSVSWDTQTAVNGSHAITAVARDAAGNTRSSAVVSVTVNNASSTGRVITISPSNADATCNEEFENVANTLQPGDTLILRGGIYTQNCRRAITANGTASNPITIRAATGETPVLTRPANNIDTQNNIEIVSSSYLIIKGVQFKGGSTGVRFVNTNDFITIEDCEVHETGNNAIAVNSGNSDGLTIRRNHIHNTGLSSGSTEGEGMYLGCNNNTCRVMNSLIENNYIHHTRGTSSGGNDGIEVKVGSGGNTIRNNVIHDTNIGQQFPAIFVYGNVAQPNIVEGNVMWNCGECIQVEADAVIRNNIILNHSITGIAAIPHAQVPTMQNVTIVNNTIYGGPECVVLSWSSASNMTFANNAVYCASGTAVNGSGLTRTGITIRNNYVAGALSGGSVDNNAFFNGGSATSAFVNAAGMNLWPAVGSVLRGTANSSFAPGFDFNGTARTAPHDVGAYETEGLNANPGWTIQPGFKSGTAPASGDTTPPSVSMTSPANGQTVSGTITVTATASDNVGVAGVQFRVDGANVGAEDATAPYSVSWNTSGVSNGSHSITAVARDAAGNTTLSSAVTVNVNNPMPPVPSCPLRGSCNLEAGLAGRTDLLLFEDWEASNWMTHWTSIGNSGNTIAVTTPVFAGARSVEVRVPTGQHDGASLNFTFKDVGLADPNEIYFRYYVRFNDTWQVNGGGEIGKLPGFGGTYGIGGWGGRQSTGTNGWSARMVGYDTGATNQVGFYTYHADMTDTYGEHMRWPDQLQRNRWYCIETRARMNSITGSRGNNDGILEGWIDDRLVFSRKNLRFSDVSNIQIQEVWGNVYVGGSWTADRNMAIHFDNAVIARNRIGCGGTTADATPPIVSITSPLNGQTVSGTISVSATASDNVGVAGVQFRIDGASLGAEDTTSPYGVTLDTTSLVNGSHQLQAVARDAAGNTSSASISISVNNGATPSPISVSISPQQVSVQAGGSVQFSATVLNAQNTSVTWTATAGTISSSGFYTAPATAGSAQVTATSVADPTKSATAQVAITSTPPPSGTCAGSTDASATIMPDSTVPPRPALGVEIRDPKLGGCYRRFSDSTASGTQEATHIYSELQAWNADGTKILLEYAGIMDAQTGARIAASPPGISERWSPTDPNVIFYLDSGSNGDGSGCSSARLMKYILNGSTTQRQLVRCFTEYSSFDKDRSWQEMSADGNRIALISSSGQAFVYDLAAQQKMAVVSVGLGIEWVQVSPSGRYLLVNYGGNGESRGSGLESFDPATGAYLGKVNTGHGHGSTAWTADGTEWYVADYAANSGTGVTGPYVVKSRLPRGHDDWKAGDRSAEVALVDHKWGRAMHVSCLSRTEWCAVSTYASSGAGPFYDEVFRVSLNGTDANPRVERLVHHYSDYSWQNSSSSCNLNGYRAQPHASISRDATQIIFGSSWGQVCRAEAYVVRLAGSPAPPPAPQALTVAITSPTGGASVSGTISLTANASSSLGIAGVQFKVDGVNVGAEDTTAPYSVSLNTATLNNGSHTVTAVVRDAAGNTATSGSVVINVNNMTSDTTPPVISGILASPNVSSAIISWATNEAADSQVEFGPTTAYGQSSALDTTRVTGHSVTLTGLLASTTYHYRVKSRDTAGNLSVSGDQSFVTLNQATSGIPSTLGWYQVPNTRQGDYCPADAFGYSFSSKCGAVIGAWGGGIADTARNRMIIWGGGHGDYAGNELYAMEFSTLTMKRLNNPSPPPSGSPAATSDGKPNSRHTYNGLAYIAHADKMFAFSGSLWSSGEARNDTWLLDLATLQWRQVSATGPSADYNVHANYDSVTKKVFVADRGSLWRFDPASEQYTRVGSLGLGLATSSVIDPKRRILFVFGTDWGGSRQFSAVNVDTGQPISMTLSGCDGLISAAPVGNGEGSGPGLDYDPVQDKIVGWVTGDTVYIFDPDTRSCTTRTFAGGPGTPNGSGTYGRFRYYPSLGVFGLVNKSGQNAYTLRLTSPQAGAQATELALSGVAAINIMAHSATVVWTTSAWADGQVACGVFAPDGIRSPLDLTPAINHAHTLNFLDADTAYQCQAMSRDSAGQLAVSPVFSFRTAR